jgi:hypothetical protein
LVIAHLIPIFLFLCNAQHSHRCAIIDGRVIKISLIFQTCGVRHEIPFSPRQAVSSYKSIYFVGIAMLRSLSRKDFSHRGNDLLLNDHFLIRTLRDAIITVNDRNISSHSSSTSDLNIP